MHSEVIQWMLRRRILLNFRVDPDVMQRCLPGRFRPVLHRGFAMAGVCLIRLERMPAPAPRDMVGTACEIAIHRVSVAWDDTQGGAREGVFVMRSDSDASRTWPGGGWGFPGGQPGAHFDADSSVDEIDYEMKSKDARVSVQLSGMVARELPSSSRFASLQEASEFFQRGSVAYAAVPGSRCLEGVELFMREWRIEPLAARHLHASYFADETRFPRGSVAFDCALVMRNIEHEWRCVPDLEV